MIPPTRPIRPSSALLAAALALAVAACDDEPAADPVIIGGDAIPDTPDAAPDAMPDAMPADAALEDMAPDAAPDVGCEPDCPPVTWREGPPLGRVVDHHTTLVRPEDDGPALYVLGGIETDAQGGAARVYDAIDRAPLDADGMPGPFAAHGRLPFPLGFHGQAIGPDRIWLTAGVRGGPGGPTGSAAIVTLPYTPDGALGEAVVCPEALPLGVVHPTAEWLADRLYVIGGTRQAPVDSVWVAAIGADGCPGPFDAAPPLPGLRSHHASAVIDGRIFVIGGFGQGQIPTPDVLASTHAADGTVDGWAPVGTLDPAPWTASAVVDGDHIWLIGGGEGNGITARFVDTVRRAPIVDGSPGAFEPVATPLPIARSHVHQTPLFEGRLYSVGGRVFMDDGFTMTSVERTFVGDLHRP